MISRFGLTSFIMAVAFSLSGHVSFAFVLLCAAAYNITIMLDSASLTAGTVSKASLQDRGATLAVHTMIGFCGSAAGAPATGLLLDLSGGQTSIMAWSATLVCMGGLSIGVDVSAATSAASLANHYIKTDVPRHHPIGCHYHIPPFTLFAVIIDKTTYLPSQFNAYMLAK